MLYQSFSFITDETLSIKHWDEGAAEISQKSASAVHGMKYYDVFPKILVNGEDALLASLGSDNELVIKDYSFQCFHGQVKADLLLSSAKSGDGKSAEVKVVITPLRACPMGEKLKDAQRYIDIGKTASVLAHGVRNPLNAIKGSVVYLRTKYASEPTLIEFTNIMEEEISRLDKFISQFLSRSLSDIELTSINVSELLNKIRAFIALQTHSANIEANFELGDCPDIMVNAFQLEQAVLNVINNAIEAMNPSGGQLRVRTMMEKRSQADFVVIEISDNGSGMSDTMAAKVEKGDRNRGRGFGLPIAREMLQHYGGTLEIKSEKNKGTAVKLYLPVRSGPV